MKLPERYNIISELGKGGEGRVFLVSDAVRGGTRLALKIAQSGVNEKTLFNEFKCLIRLNHPSLAKVYDLGRFPEDRSRIFLVREYIEGEDILQYQDLSWKGIIPFFKQILSGLSYIHHQGLIHGDIKASNILITSTGAVKIIDFGMVWHADIKEGTARGTLLYLAPEILHGQYPDRRSDLYSLGVLLWRIIFGEFPFKDLQIKDIPPFPQKIPPLAQTILKGLLSPNPKDRFQNADQVLMCLELQMDQRDTISPIKSFSPPSLDISKTKYEKVIQRLNDLISPLEKRKPPSVNLVLLHEESGIGARELLHEFRIEVLLKNLAAILSCIQSSDDDHYAPLKQALSELGISMPDDISNMDVLSFFENISWRVIKAVQHIPLVLFLGNMHYASCSSLKLLEHLLLAANGENARLLVIVSGATGPWLEHFQKFPERLEITLPPLASKESEIYNPLRLPDSLRKVLEPISVADCCVEATSLARLLDIPLSNIRSSLQELHVRGFLRFNNKGYQIAEPEIAKKLLSSLSKKRISFFHSFWAKEIKPVDALSRFKVLYHLVRSGQVKAALSLTRRMIRDFNVLQNPLTVATVLEEILSEFKQISQPESENILKILIDIYLKAGDFEKAKRIANTVQEPSELQDLRLGEFALRTGDLSTADKYLAKVSSSHDRDIYLQGAVLYTSLKLKQGEFKEAQRLAKSLLQELPKDHYFYPEVQLSLGMAGVQLGQASEGNDHFGLFEEALRHFQRHNNLSGQAKAHNFMAIALDQKGKIIEAKKHYQESVRIAEKGSDIGRLPIYYLNLGTAEQHLGELAKALKNYHRGLLLARRAKLLNTMLSLRYNLSNLLVFIGRLKEAENLAKIGLNDTKSLGLKHHEGPFLRILGEINEYQGDVEKAKHFYKEALKISQKVESKTNTIDALICLAGVDKEKTREHLSLALNLSNEIGADDLLAYVLLKQVERGSKTGDNDETRALLEKAYSLSKHTGNYDVLWQACANLAYFYESSGSHVLSRKYLVEAMEILERMSYGLTPPDQEYFWSHPKRKEIKQLIHKQDTPKNVKKEELEKCYRLLDLNSRILLEQDEVRLFMIAMDTAIELVSAERGFLLLSKPSGEFDIRIARNIKKEEIINPRMEFSRSLAERVVRTGLPIMTIDAMKDPRFKEIQSIQDIKVHSILCVPIKRGNVIEGAIYLDNLNIKGGFQKEDQRLLMAFADQVALALTNLRLISELNQAKNKIEQLLHEREAMLKESKRELRKAKNELLSHISNTIVGQSSAIENIRDIVNRLAWNDGISVLIEGETGTGKEVIARAIHYQGIRKKYKFLAVNCAAFPKGLLESELFGHVRGSFTGATRDRDGIFVASHKGTIFLDEIRDMPLDMQVKLLRVLEEGKVRPIGSETCKQIDVRIIAASHQNLEEMVQRGSFREDLFFRLSGVRIKIPPLRERIDDIIPLAEHFLKKIAKESNEKPLKLTSKAVETLLRYQWPGNVRQLENVLRAAHLIAKGGIIHSDDLKIEEIQSQRPLLSYQQTPTFNIAETERERIEACLKATQGNRSQAARLLGISRTTLYRRLKKASTSNTKHKR